MHPPQVSKNSKKDEEYIPFHRLDPGIPMVIFERKRKNKEIPEDAPALVAEGDACISRGEFAAAISLFGKALDKDPRSAHAYTGRGLALKRLGRDREALEDFAAALEIAAGRADTRAKKGVPLKAPGKTPGAPAASGTAPANDILGADAWYDKGIAYGSMGDFQRAADCFDKVLEINAGHAGAWYNQGRALGKLGSFLRAIDSFDHALALAPDNADAWYYKGITFVRLKKIPEAYACFENVVALQPGHKKAEAGLKELAAIMDQMKKRKIGTSKKR